MLLFKIVLAVLVIWVLAGAIPLVYELPKSRRRAFAGLAVFSVAMLAYLFM